MLRLRRRNLIAAVLFLPNVAMPGSTTGPCLWRCIQVAAFGSQSPRGSALSHLLVSRARRFDHQAAAFGRLRPLRSEQRNRISQTAVVSPLQEARYVPTV